MSLTKEGVSDNGTCLWRLALLWRWWCPWRWRSLIFNMSSTMVDVSVIWNVFSNGVCLWQWKLSPTTWISLTMGNVSDNEVSLTVKVWQWGLSLTVENLDKAVVSVNGESLTVEVVADNGRGLWWWKRSQTQERSLMMQNVWQWGMSLTMEDVSGLVEGLCQWRLSLTNGEISLARMFFSDNGEYPWHMRMSLIIEYVSDNANVFD